MLNRRDLAGVDQPKIDDVDGNLRIVNGFQQVPNHIFVELASVLRDWSFLRRRLKADSVCILAVDTIHLAVVDPGVGSARRPVLALCAGQFFVGPDNGLFSYVLEREPPASVIHIQNQKYFRQPLSATFHGRDLFAPVAAALANGVEPSEFGAEVTDYVRLQSLAPIRLPDGTIHARIIHIDRFGNCITNLTKEDVADEIHGNSAQLSIDGRGIDSFQTYFAEEGASRDEGLFAIWGSAGFLEIAARNASAAEMLDAYVGQAVLFKNKVVSPTQ